jgi:cellulose synthase/poly-beta-1,6-N-acetylglucosamine synthase-like glycosyltransferase
MSSPGFTVALKAFNEEDWIENAIASVLAQTREDFELIVVDDGSSDGTVDVVRRFESDPRVRLISQANQGVSAAVNTAINAGSAPYISLIDADDLWMPEYLEVMGNTLDADPGAGFGYTDAWTLEHPSGRFRRLTTNTGMGEPVPAPTDPEQFLRLLIEANFVFGLATIRRSALEAVGGGFNPSLKSAEEYELWIRMLAAGYRAARAPGAPLAIVRDRQGSLHTDERTMISSVQEVCRIAAEDLDTSAEVKSRARARIERLDRNLAALEGEAPATAAWQAVRRRLGAIRRTILARRFWYPGTPPGVAKAFPELERPKR